MAKILVTGGAGYIGSHTCVELLEAGHEVIVFDNLSNSSKESLNRVQEITQKSLTFVEGDIRNSDELDQVFQDHAIDAVIHFAGLKAVGESQKNRLFILIIILQAVFNWLSPWKRQAFIAWSLARLQLYTVSLIHHLIRKICLLLCPIIIMAIPN